MPISFDVSSSAGKYNVDIKQGAVTDLLAKQPGAYVIADEIMKPLMKGKPGIAIKANEESKEYDAIGAHLKQLRELQLTRSGTIIAIGGGVIQDIAGFTASIYMRGVKWHYAPTTLLGMVDSCIGGKSSINVKGSKNLVGTFHPPASIAIDPAFISTLTLEQKIAGLCEAAKICFAHNDRKIFDSYLELKCLEKDMTVTYEAVITKSLQSKKWFIETDEFDQNERQLLNFGHSFGHAIEAAGNYSISHGIGVGIGMLCAMEFQMIGERGYTAHARTVQLRQHIESMLSKLPALKPEIKKLNPDTMLEALRADKKHTAAEYFLIVPDARGGLVRKKVARGAVADMQIKQAMQKVIVMYG